MSKNVIKGNPEYDATLDTQDLTELFNDVEETQKWSKIKESCENGDVKIKLFRRKQHPKNPNFGVEYRWEIGIYAGDICVVSWRTPYSGEVAGFINRAECWVDFLTKHPPEFYVDRRGS